MKKNRIITCIALSLILVFGSFGAVHASDTHVVLNFEDLPSFVAPIPTNYAGLQWQNGWYYNKGVGANYRRHSGVTGAYFIFENDGKAYIDFSLLEKDVLFEGAWFGGHGGTGGIYFEGWRDGNLVATSGVLVIDSINQWKSNYLAANFGVPVDRVYVCTVSRTRINEFIMDDFAYLIPGTIDVSIDVAANVNLKSKGVLPICIYGSEEFDVTEINPATVMIGNTCLNSQKENVQFAFEDANGDGCLDAVCKFSIPELIGNGQLDTNTECLKVTGELFVSGDEFEGTDMINIVPK